MNVSEFLGDKFCKYIMRVDKKAIAYTASVDIKRCHLLCTSYIVLMHYVFPEFVPQKTHLM